MVFILIFQFIHYLQLSEKCEEKVQYKHFKSVPDFSSSVNRFLSSTTQPYCKQRATAMKHTDELEIKFITDFQVSMT